MITLPLTIRPQPGPVGEPVAWLLPGDQPREWLAELVAWQIPLQQVTLYPLPRTTGRGASGVVAVPPRGVACRVSRRAVPYRAVAGRIYLPVDAALEPFVADDELAPLFASDIAVYVFHPTLGLIGFGRDHELSVAELLQLPPRDHAAWDRARPGIAFNQRLVSIVLGDPPSLPDIFAAAKDDIGSQTSSLSSLPPTPNEPSNNPLSKACRKAGEGLAKAVQWMTSFAPQTASKPTWIDSVQQWAAAKLSTVTEAVDAIRNKEIRRLLSLLDNDPDAGLRYAVPLDGPAHRGVAPPTNSLVRRNVDFQLAGLGGGGPVDYWTIDWRHRQRLSERYRELANREIRLGRHRRAAYIFAELLNDLNAAARTLVDGGHYREAAVLYRERLSRPRQAAECLEQGGFYGEAIRLFRELGDLERVGDLHAKIDQHDEAHAAYRVAADAYASGGDLLGAARILENKMRLPDEALAALEAAWPNSPQVRSCLAELFQLLGRLGRHDAAQDHVAVFRDTNASEPHSRTLAATLSHVAVSYPNDAVRETASDGCRVLVGRRLPQALQQERSELLHAVECLAREDRLLQRDCGRYRRQPLPQLRRVAVPPKGQRDEPRLINQFELPSGVQWTNIAAAGMMFYAAGYRGNELILVRGNWDGTIQQPTGKPWRVHPSIAAGLLKIQLAPPANGSGDVWVNCPLAAPGAPREFPIADQIGAFTRAVSPPHGFALDVARSSSGLSYTVREFASDGLVLDTYSSTGALIASRDLPLPETIDWMFANSSVRLLACNEVVYLTHGQTLFQIDGENIIPETLPAPIVSLSGAARHQRTRLAAMFEQGGVVIWPNGIDLSRQQRFGKDLCDPLACFTKTGLLVAVSQSACEVYDTVDEHVELLASLPGTSGAPIAVLPAGHPHDFALCTADGAVKIYRWQ